MHNTCELYSELSQNTLTQTLGINSSWYKKKKNSAEIGMEKNNQLNTRKTHNNIQKNKAVEISQFILQNYDKLLFKLSWQR